MTCKYLKECGSCTLFTPYDEQILFKTETIKQNFSEFFNGEFEFFASSPSGYRTRAEFGIWHEIRASSNDICYTMHSREKGKKIFIDECPKVCAEISALMPRLLDNVCQNEQLRVRLFGVEFLASSAQILVTLLYHKNLDENFLPLLKELENALKGELNICIMARSRGVKLLSSEPKLLDELCINGEKFKLSLSENAFTQPNKGVNEKMIGWAKSCVYSENLNGVFICQNEQQNFMQNATNQPRDLLELYCGHGNFTIPLSRNFRNVLATEISKSSIENALKNCELNDAQNIKFLRMDADDLMSAFAREREFNRLKDIDIFSYDISHVLVDPPRAGLSASVVNFIKKYDNIIYISCNPQTLKENLYELCKTHEVVKFAIFDQFANTHHIECGVLLRAKSRI